MPIDQARRGLGVWQLSSGLPYSSFRNHQALVQVLRLLESHPPEVHGARHKLQGLHQHAVRLGRGLGDKARPSASRSHDPRPFKWRRLGR